MRCLDERAFTGEPLPESLCVTYPLGSRTREAGVRQSIALFNWTDQDRVVAAARSEMGQDGPVMVEDFWTGEKGRWDQPFVIEILPRRSARLWDVVDGPIAS